jgi:hypothetical protein
MEKLNKVISLLACAAMITLGAVTANAQLADGSFETTGLPNWTTFNYAFQLAYAGALDGTHVLQVYGPFNSNWDGSGAYQNIAASAGQSWTLNGFALNPSGDAMQAGSFGLIQLVFKDASLNTLATFSSANFAAGAPTDVWTALSASGVAPANTAYASIYTLHLSSPSNAGGSIYFDELSAVPEPSSIALVLVGLVGFVTVLRKRHA